VFRLGAVLILRICGVAYLAVGVDSLSFHNMFLTFSGSSLVLGVDLKSAGSSICLPGRVSWFHGVFVTFSRSSPALGIDLKFTGSNIGLPGSSLIVPECVCNIFGVEYMSAGVETLRFVMCF
jgi:hypothetical protein